MKVVELFWIFLQNESLSTYYCRKTKQFLEKMNYTIREMIWSREKNYKTIIVSKQTFYSGSVDLETKKQDRSERLR